MSACSKPSSGRSSSRQPHKPAQRESGGEKLPTSSEISKSTAQPPKQSSKADRELLVRVHDSRGVSVSWCPLSGVEKGECNFEERISRNQVPYNTPTNLSCT